MLRFVHLLLLLSAVAYSSAQDLGKLRNDLQAKGITAVFADNALYPNATEAYNLRYKVSPVAVTYPTSAEQVSAVLLAGTKQSLRVVARSGGHSYIANGLGGKNGALVVDLSKMLKIAYNSKTHVATIEPGNRLGDVAVALNKYGRGLPHGRCNSVGIGGHAGYGGWGFASRMWGLTLDNVQGVTAVLANGTIVTASKKVHPDLFWAIRGASGSFGIVTAFQFGTHAVPSSATAFTYSWSLDTEASIAQLEAYQKFTTSPKLPANIGFDLIMLGGATKGTLQFYLLGEFYGSATSFNKTMLPFLSSVPVPDTTALTTGTWIQAMEAVSLGPFNTSSAPPMHDTFYAKSLMTPQSTPFTSKAIRKLVEYCANDAFGSEGFWHIEIELYGGAKSAINAVPRHETAFVNRDTLFTLQIYASAPNSLPPFPESGYKLIDDIQAKIVDNMPKNWDYGGYVNYIDDRLQNWQDLYYGENYSKLQRLKKAIDPKDVFMFPFSIEE